MRKDVKDTARVGHTVQIWESIWVDATVGYMNMISPECGLLGLAIWFDTIRACCLVQQSGGILMVAYH